MLGIDRQALKIAWTVFLFALVGVLLYEARHTLMIFALALFFSHLLAPVVAFFERTGHKRVPRVAILVLVYVAVLALIVAAMISVGSRIGEEAASLAARLSDVMKQPDPLSRCRCRLARICAPGWQFLKDRVADLEKQVLPLLSSAGLQILSGIGNVSDAILIPILSFFFLKDGAAIRKTIVESFSRGRISRWSTRSLWICICCSRSIFGRWCCWRSRRFLFYAGFLSIASVPYAILLAGIAAIFEFIPVVGPLTASAIIMLVAAFTGYPHLLWIVIFLVVYRIFQDYVLNPYLMSSGVEVDPLLVLFGVLAGEQIAGVPGMFFSVPVIAALRVFYVRLRRQRLVAE